jgi:hypothetical protein
MSVTAAELGAVASAPAAPADDGLTTENPLGLRDLPCSLRKRTPLPEPVKSAAHFLRKLPPVALDSLFQRGHRQPRARQPKGETMSNPDQAPGYDGEPTYPQDEYDEYLGRREETEPQTR